MQRRLIVTLLGGVILAPPALRAQQRTLPVIGYLGLVRQPASLAAFRQGLAEGGYVEGSNVIIEYRWAEYSMQRLPELAADLVNRKVNVIVTSGGPPPALAAKRATSTIPVFFTAIGDPIGDGLVSSLARPGGNVTGLSILVVELNAKRFDLLCELVPQARLIAFIVNPSAPQAERVLLDVQGAARTKGVQLLVLRAVTSTEVEAAFSGLVQSGAAAVLIEADPLFHSLREKVVALAARHAVPAMYEFRESVEIGGLISYGPNLVYFNHQAGIYAARILKGEKPSDLPIQQPTKVELVINLQTAKELGLTVPQSLLARADAVIE